MFFMKKFLYVILGFTITFSSYAKVDIAAGKEKAEIVCAACHGPDGNSTVPMWPKLAGQHSDYLVLQMQAFKEGKLRNDASMMGMMAPLSLQDMKNLAAYFNSQKIVIGEASPKLVKRGEAIYRGGNADKHITACIACHGPKGNGNAQAGFPALSGQQNAYTVQQLQNYKSGSRMTDKNSIMRDISSRMNKADMEAVASYISGLH